MPIIAPFEAFARDAVALNVEEDDSRLPVRWLAAAQVASRIADARPQERKALLRTWVRQQEQDGADGVWTSLTVPGIPVTDLASASTALCHIAADMERGGALNLAYATVTNMRLALMDRGPVGPRASATIQQARVLREMGLLEEAQDTYEAAREDAVRAKDTELEARAWEGLAVVAGHRGNYPEVITLAKRALSMLPANSEFAGPVFADLTIASGKLGDFAAALDYGWKGFDAATDAERKASMVVNLASLALRMGRCRAALKGFGAGLSMTALERIQFPALGGLALACAAQHDANELQRVAAQVDRLAPSSTLPYELAGVCLESAQAWKEVGDLEKSKQCLSRASDLSTAHGFHEVAFRSELLAEALAAARKPTRVKDQRIETAIARFDELPVGDFALAAL